MKIEVKCFATLSGFSPENGELELTDGANIGNAMDALGIPHEEVKIMFINGTHKEPETILHHGDRLGLFPAVGGG